MSERERKKSEYFRTLALRGQQSVIRNYSVLMKNKWYIDKGLWITNSS